MKRLFVVALLLILLSAFYLRNQKGASVHADAPLHHDKKPVQPLQVHKVVETPSRKLAQVLLPVSAQNDVEKARNLIARFKGCYESGCGLGENDPKGPYFEIGKRIQAELRDLTTKVESAQLEDESVSLLARESLENSDGHVKEAALDLIATQPPSSENLDAILQGVIADSDPELIEQGLLELSRYERSGDQDQVNQALRESLIHGAPFVAMRVAEQIGSILNSRNYGFFNRVATEMEDGSQIKAKLLRSLASARL